MAPYTTPVVFTDLQPSASAGASQDPVTCHLVWGTGLRVRFDPSALALSPRGHVLHPAPLPGPCSSTRHPSPPAHVWPLLPSDPRRAKADANGAQGDDHAPQDKPRGWGLVCSDLVPRLGRFEGAAAQPGQEEDSVTFIFFGERFPVRRWPTSSAEDRGRLNAAAGAARVSTED